MNKNVPFGKEFKFENHTVKSIEELLLFLEKTDETSFKKYVKSGKNNFAEWVRNVHYDETLAKKLDKAKSRFETIAILRSATKRHYEYELKRLKEEVESNLSEQETEIKPQLEEADDFMRKEFVFGAIFGFVIGFLLFMVMQAL